MNQQTPIQDLIPDLVVTLTGVDQATLFIFIYKAMVKAREEKDTDTFMRGNDVLKILTGKSFSEVEPVAKAVLKGEL